MRLQVFVYRRSGGRRMAHLRGMPILVLTTAGRRTGKERVTPVMYFQDGESFVITASNNGRDRQPSWFLNLKAQPQAKIEVGGMTKVVIARQASVEERGRLWPQLVERAPFFDGYQQNAPREIPMVILKPAS